MVRFAVCMNPGLAVVFLHKLAAYGLRPTQVITPQPAPRRWRRWRRSDNEITQFAAAQGWPLCLVRDACDPLLAQTLRRNPVDWLCVFGFALLPPSVLVLPRSGVLNLHPSLLPAHRGAQPVYWNLRAGEVQAGLSLIRLDTGIDTGAIVEQHALPLSALDDAQSVLHRLSVLGAKVFTRRLLRLAAGEALPLTPQSERLPYEPIPDAATLSLSPELPPAALVRQVAAAAALGGARWRDADGRCWRVLDVLHLPEQATAPALMAGHRLLPWPGQAGTWLVARTAAC